MKRTVYGIILIIVSVSMLTTAFNIHSVKASGTIYIRADGSVEGTTYIQSTDNVTYAFTANINDSITVQRNNIIVDGKGHALQGGGSGIGIDLSGRTNVTVHNVQVKFFGSGVELNSSLNNVISSNSMTNDSMGISLDYSSGNSISGNNIANNSGTGIGLSYSPHNVVSGNNVTANYYGIVVSYCSGNTVSGNNVANSAQWGIYLHYSSGNAVSGNNAAHNYRGIQLDSSSSCTVTGNSVTNSIGIGIVLRLTSANCNVSGNSVANNGDAGIALGGSGSGNTVSGNNIANNYCGISAGASGNVIYHNNIKNNQLQVLSIEETNVWDNGYPSGGNYWSDYTGSDTNHDGIGDTPYVIDANNKDRYPLMSSFAVPTGTTPPGILILSPESKKYSTDSISLQFTVNKPTSWIGYSLDSHSNSTIAGNTTISNLSEGAHSLKIYAKDISGNIGVSQIVNFSINKTGQPFPAWTLATAIAIASIVILVFLMKLKKTKKTKT